MNFWKKQWRKPKETWLILSAMFLLSVLFGCAGTAPWERAEKDKGSEGRLRVVTTLFPYYDFTRQVAGDTVELFLVLPAGMDSHSFEPTPADIRLLQSADVIVCNGGAMEQWLQKVLAALDTSRMTVVSMMDYVDTVEEELVEGMEGGEPGHEDEHAHGAGNEYAAGQVPGAGNDRAAGHAPDVLHAVEYDEHIWTSPRNAMEITRVIAQTLSEADPEHAPVYAAGRDAYLEKLAALDAEFKRLVAEADYDMVVIGDKFPFRYFTDAYGLRYGAAFSGCSTDTEPSARTIAYLIERVKSENLPAVYYLELSSSRVAEIISEETGAKPLLWHSCHNVTRREFENGVTYLELMEQNAENLREGLVR